MLIVAAAAATHAGADGHSLRVVSYNLTHDWPRHCLLAERVEILAQELLVQQVDIACLQEIVVMGSVDEPQILADRSRLTIRYARANGSAALIGFEEELAVASCFPIVDWAVRRLPWPGPFKSRVAV